MLSRRDFLTGGLSAVAIGLLARLGLGQGPLQTLPPIRDSLPGSGPFARLPALPPSIDIDGLPFLADFTGDGFPNSSIPFHSCESCSELPEPTETTRVAIVGGGISGLATGYLLRGYNPLLFELHPRFGGNAQGEIWQETPFSLGNAYFITPDPGTFLEQFYTGLGLDKVVRVQTGEDLYELGGTLVSDFFETKDRSPEDQLAFTRYRELVLRMANEEYPEIPLPKGQDNRAILNLDRKSLKQHIQEQLGVPIPTHLASAIQGYCYSSFAAGWEEISAASGWNFLAAEEFGRWVLPGGTAYLADAMWNQLARLEKPVRDARHQRRPSCLRGGSRVVDVRLTQDKVRVTYRDASGSYHGLIADNVVVCCPKHICKYILHDLESIDPEKRAAFDQLHQRAYVVVNVLLDSPVELDFYDAFLLGDGSLPTNQDEALAQSRVTDMLSGHYNRGPKTRHSVLTLYWPLPFAFGRATLIETGSHTTYAERLVPQVRSMLKLLDIDPKKVVQIRMSRWGHAMPVASPDLIANGTVDKLRRSIDDRIHFVNQDNWALPAVENCLLDAKSVTDLIRAKLG